MIAVFLLCAAPLAAADLTMTTTDATVVVGGATASQDVLLFGVVRYTTGPRERMYIHRMVASADAQGRASFDVPVRGNFLVLGIDVETGRYVIDHARPLQHFAFVVQRDGASTIETPLLTFEFLVVRPGTGAWAMSGHDGGPGDDDRSMNSSTRLLLSQSEKLSGNVPLATIKRGDLLFAVDPFSLELYTAEVR